MNVKIDTIKTDGGTQPRSHIDWLVVDDYLSAMQDGTQFPPVVVFFDGNAYWLADGYHRLEAAKRAGSATISADVRQGTRRDAVLYSVGANAAHGLRRTNEDKRRAVLRLLEDAEWGQWSDREIARRCCVDGKTVAVLRESNCGIPQLDSQRTYTTKHGTTATMNTANIGKPAPLSLPPPLVIADKPALRPSSRVTIYNADAQYLASLVSAPVHLVITSPPYNVGMEYSEYRDSISTYAEMLTAVWRQCHSVMVDGARIAVVVPFGVGRNPWVPLAAKVAETLQEAGFILRGQIVWDKGTSGGRTTWGSFRLPSDPSLRDTCEAIIVAHKGESRLELPDGVTAKDEKGTHTIWLAESDRFMELAQDHWLIPPESASRIGHPAPFPVELAERLIRFYAYPGAHVLDPFAGSGTVGVAAQLLGCDASLVEMDGGYCELMKGRL